MTNEVFQKKKWFRFRPASFHSCSLTNSYPDRTSTHSYSSRTNDRVCTQYLQRLKRPSGLSSPICLRKLTISISHSLHSLHTSVLSLTSQLILPWVSSILKREGCTWREIGGISIFNRCFSAKKLNPWYITFLCNSKDCLWSCFNDGSDSSKCFSLRIGWQKISSPWRKGV